MRIIVPVDDRMGMQFHHRRQSRDRKLNEWILQQTGGSLKIAPYSASLFPDVPASEHFLDNANPTDTCFVEDRALSAYQDLIDQIWLCRWNRDYPGDLFFDLDLSDWTLTESLELAGSSHDTITIERYERNVS